MTISAPEDATMGTTAKTEPHRPTPLLAMLGAGDAAVAAVALAHVGRARTERATSDRIQGRTALVFFLASLVVIIVAVPTVAWPI